ncbi:chromate efflux transporter [Marinobacter sp.]|uniref:chromate efflux transporter n=1 Tax=Marinobacter sp. TaxID=50741 RepID=UPI00384E9C7D
MEESKYPCKVSLALMFRVFLRLGLTSFGGPAAHIGFFHDEFVKRRQWLSDSAYGEIVALCQLLPGPASSQVGLTLGFLQRGYAGAGVAWLGFTLPSALVMTLFALGFSFWPAGGEPGWIAGLKLFVVAVVAQAVWQMGRTLCPDRVRLALALAVAALLLVTGAAWIQVFALAAAGVAGASLHRPDKDVGAPLTLPVQGRWPLAFMAIFAVLLVLSLLPLGSGGLLWLGAEMFRAGALVFGGGHVVLPWLQESFVASGQMPTDTFLAGYGAAQAVPGPLFTFSAFIGTIEAGLTGAVVALVAVFLPGTLLVFAGLPLWGFVRRHPRARAALAGVNAGVVGLLLAALYDPVWTSAVHSATGLALVLILWAGLAIWRVPVWLLAVASALAGALAL